jgi:hypothetical protein
VPAPSGCAPHAAAARASNPRRLSGKYSPPAQRIARLFTEACPRSSGSPPRRLRDRLRRSGNHRRRFVRRSGVRAPPACTVTRPPRPSCWNARRRPVGHISVANPAAWLARQDQRPAWKRNAKLVSGHRRWRAGANPAEWQPIRLIDSEVRRRRTPRSPLRRRSRPWPTSSVDLAPASAAGCARLQVVDRKENIDARRGRHRIAPRAPSMEAPLS